MARRPSAKEPSAKEPSAKEMRPRRWVVVLALCVAACGGAERPVVETAPAADSVATRGAEPLLAEAMARIDARLAAVDSVFQPLPLLRAPQEAALRRYGYQEQLGRAQALGPGRDLSDARVETLRREGRLVPLTDTEHWVVRELDYSQALVVPAVRDLLHEVGRRFQGRLDALGAPPYRMEVSSVLRTAADQAALRQVNPNAVGGVSTHEYGVTVDVLYSAYAAPSAPVVSVEVPGAPWLAPALRRYAEVAAERVAGRRALELKAILGEVLIDVQREGLVMVTFEERQPVFHLTLARVP